VGVVQVACKCYRKEIISLFSISSCLFTPVLRGNWVCVARLLYLI